jgi:hypothetical protein
MTAGSNERVNCTNECIDGNSKPEKDEADTWRTLREAGKESLQPVPPKAQRRARKKASFFRCELDPQNECFFCTT